MDSSRRKRWKLIEKGSYGCHRKNTSCRKKPKVFDRFLMRGLRPFTHRIIIVNRKLINYRCYHFSGFVHSWMSVFQYFPVLRRLLSTIIIFFSWEVATICALFFIYKSVSWQKRLNLFWITSSFYSLGKHFSLWLSPRAFGRSDNFKRRSTLWFYANMMLTACYIRGLGVYYPWQQSMNNHSIFHLECERFRVS